MKYFEDNLIMNNAAKRNQRNQTHWGKNSTGFRVAWNLHFPGFVLITLPLLPHVKR